VDPTDLAGLVEAGFNELDALDALTATSGDVDAAMERLLR